MTEIISWSAVETARRIRSRDISVTEVVEAHLARLEAVNPHLNAITEVVTDSLDLAKQLDAQTGADPLPPLHGVPVTTKTNVDQGGFSNSNGIPAFAGTICEADSAVVGNLKASGAIVIGRTNTPEFSMRWCTSNPLHGVSKNPWHEALTPGGSSGAAAAAVAAGVGAIAHGNDLGGSLRYPAFCCGVASIKPSFGRVPAYNPSAAVERPPILQTMSVQGPIARSIADVRLGLSAMSARSAHDPYWTAATSSGRERTDKVRVGYSVNPFNGSVDPALETAIERARQGLEAAGIETIEADPPNAEDAAMVWGRLLATEINTLMRPMIEEYGSPELIRVINAYADYFGGLDLEGLFAGMQERIRLQRAWSGAFDTIDLFMMPTSLNPPFENDLDFKQPDTIPWILNGQKPLYIVNLLGLPSVALPTHVADGAPVGIQLIAPMHDDWFALDVAERLEAELGGVLGDMPVRPFS